MTDTNATLSDKQLADNVRAAADALAAAMNKAAESGIRAEVHFLEVHEVASPIPKRFADVRVERGTAL